MKSITIFTRLFVTLVLSLMSLSVSAQNSQYDGEKARVDKLFAAWDKPESPGCALGVVKDGDLIYKRGYGMANLDYGIPISAKTSFYIASTSKQFTAASVALLARKGKLSLDDDIRKYLPEIPQYQSTITVRHLIHHTSGLRDYLELTVIAGKYTEDVNSDEDFVRLIARQKSLNFKPGEKYIYSNSGYFLLSQIVKRVTGKSLRVYADENLFKPLGMVNTFFHDDRTAVIKNRATGYSPRVGGFSVVMTNFDRVGDGGLYTSIDDLLLWDRNFYDNKLPGGADFISGMLTQGVLNSGEKIDYAFALIPSVYKGLKMIAHGGSFNGFRAEMIRFPDQKFSVACICNLANINASSLATRVADIFLEKQLKQPVGAGRVAGSEPTFVPLSEQELSNVAGLYFNPTSETARRIVVKEGKLWFVRGPNNSSELKPVSPSVFRMADTPTKVEITFTPVPPAKTSRMHITAGDGKPDIYESRTPAAYSDQDRSKFVGAYYSEELDAKYVFSVKDNKLVVKVGANEIKLEELFADVFTSPQGQFIKFRRDGQYRITGFLLSSFRAKELPFSRIQGTKN